MRRTHPRHKRRNWIGDHQSVSRSFPLGRLSKSSTLTVRPAAIRRAFGSSIASGEDSCEPFNDHEVLKQC
jgi:hypothetical protein